MLSSTHVVDAGTFSRHCPSHPDVHLVVQAALLGLPLHFRAVRIGKEEEAVAKLN